MVRVRRFDDADFRVGEAVQLAGELVNPAVGRFDLPPAGKAGALGRSLDAARRGPGSPGENRTWYVFGFVKRKLSKICDATEMTQPRPRSLRLCC